MKTVLDSLDGLSDEVKAEYEVRDDKKFYIKLEGQPSGYVSASDLLAANTKVVEFRDKNIALMKENAELVPLKTKYEGIDPEEAREALKKVKALGKEGIRDADDLAAKIKSAAEELIAPLRTQLQTSQAEAQLERQRADASLLHSFIADRFVKAGGKSAATEYVVNLAKENFEVKDGKVMAKAGKFSTAKPGDPLTAEEWLTSDIQKNHDYVFQPSNGGGAPPAKPGGTTVPSKTKPGQTILKNPTPQQLGEFSTDIASGKVRVEHDQVTQ